MKLETDRLILRTVHPDDVQSIYRICYDMQVMEYIPDLLGREPKISDIEDYIAKFLKYEELGDMDLWRLYIIEKKDTGDVIGTISFGRSNMLFEPEMGWQVMGEYTKKGYASEAARAFAEWYCSETGADYLIAIMDTDNPASFRTAEKAGFRLFEKRTVYDYSYNGFGDDYYYFRRYREGCSLKEKFYGDVPYTGR